MTGVVVVFTNSTSARVSWLAVQLPPDGLLTGYSVYYRSLPNTSKMQSGGYISQTFPPTTTSGDITNLSPNGMYQFIVVAEVTTLGQLYIGEVDTTLAVSKYYSSCSPDSTPVSDSHSTPPPSSSRGELEHVLIGALVSVSVGLLLSIVIMIAVNRKKKIRLDYSTSIMLLCLLVNICQSCRCPYCCIKRCLSGLQVCLLLQPFILEPAHISSRHVRTNTCILLVARLSRKNVMRMVKYKLADAMKWLIN